MIREEAMFFKPFVDRKLSAEGLEASDQIGAKSALIKCVMGAKLVKAFVLLYGVENATN